MADWKVLMKDVHWKRLAMRSLDVAARKWIQFAAAMREAECCA